MNVFKYIDDKDMLERLLMDVALSGDHWDQYNQCRVVDADEGRVKVEMDILEEHANTFGTLHGGMTATLVDIVTTTALCATRRGSPGVSVDLTVNYMAPAKIGDTILIDAFVNRRGQTMAFTGADIFRKSDGLKIATALHTKAFPRYLTEASTSVKK